MNKTLKQQLIKEAKECLDRINYLLDTEDVRLKNK